MNLSIIIYLASIIGHFKMLMILVVVFCILHLFLLLIISFFRAENSALETGTFEFFFQDLFVKSKRIFIIYVALIVFNIFIPKKDDIYLIAALSVGQKMIESDEAKKLFEKSFQLLNSKIEGYLKKDQHEHVNN